MRSELYTPVLSVALMEDKPCIIHDSSTGMWSGWCYKLLQRLAKDLDFKIQTTKHNENTSTDDLIREVQSGRVDMSFNYFYINAHRQAVVDFLFPIQSVHLGAVMRQVPIRHYFRMFEPLEGNQWLLFLVAILLFSVCFFFTGNVTFFGKNTFNRLWEIIKNRSCRKTRVEAISDDVGIEDGIDHAIGKIIGAGDSMELQTFSSKIISFSFWFFNFITFSMYTANLAAFMMKEAYEKPVQSVTDLVTQSEHGFGIFKDWSGDAYFFEDHNAVLKKIAAAKTTLPRPITYNSTKEFIDAVLKQQKAFITNTLFLTELTNQYCAQRLYLLDGFFNQEMMAFAVNATNVVKKFADVGRDVTVGDVDALMLNYSRSGELNVYQDQFAYPICSQATGSADRSVTVEEMAGLYIITAVLMVIGVVISCFEKHGEKKRRQEKLQKSKISTAIKMQAFMSLLQASAKPKTESKETEKEQKSEPKEATGWKEARWKTDATLNNETKYDAI